MSRAAAEIAAANCFHAWRMGWRDGAMRRAANPAATGHSDAAMAQAYRDGFAEGFKTAGAANAAACERYGHAPAILRAEAAMGETARRALAPGELSAEERVAAERARCAAVCREVAAQAVGPLALDAGVRRGATTCAEAIERGAVER